MDYSNFRLQDAPVFYQLVFHRANGRPLKAVGPENIIDAFLSLRPDDQIRAIEVGIRRAPGVVDEAYRRDIAKAAVGLRWIADRHMGKIYRSPQGADDKMLTAAFRAALRAANAQNNLRMDIVYDGQPIATVMGWHSEKQFKKQVDRFFAWRKALPWDQTVRGRWKLACRRFRERLHIAAPLHFRPRCLPFEIKFS